MTTIKKTISEMWEGTRESRESKTGLVLLTFMSILAYAGVMALVYTIVGKPVFAVTYTNAFAATCVIFWRKRNENTIATINRKRVSVIEYMAIPIIVIVVNLSATLIALWVKQTLNYQSPAQQLTETTPAVAIAIMSLIIAPIGEEALMRGFLYPLLRTRFSAASTIAITTLLFALLHGNLIQIILTIPLGIALGYLYERTQNLTACISAHMLFNAIALVLPSVPVKTTQAAIAVVILPITFILWVNLPREIARRKEARQVQ